MKSFNLLKNFAKNQTQNKRSFVTFVKQGFTAQRTFFGKNATKLNPGLHFYVPIAHRIIQVDMREDSIDINNLKAYTKDNVPVSIDGTLFCQVVDSYKACFEATDVYCQVKDIGASTARSIVGTMDYDSIIADRTHINNVLQTVIGETCVKWGVDCTKFEIQDFCPQNRDVEKQLELQMKAERERREQILNTEAQVNIADGHKRASILKSEGDLEATKNEAIGLLIKEQKSADADRYKMEQYSKGLQIQIEDLVEVLGSQNEASRYLIEQSKLTHLSSIGSGHNNSTYFMPDPSSNIIPTSKIVGDLFQNKK